MALRSSGSPSAQRVAHPADLIERERELRTLAEQFEQARAGAGSIVLIDGPPGVGRSTLLAAALTMASADGMETLVAAGRKVEGEVSFGVTVQLLQDRVRRAGPDESARLLSWGARLAAPLFSDDAPVAIAEPHLFSIVHGLYWLCANLAGEQPVVLAIDDIHLADLATVRFLHYLGERIVDQPIALLLTGAEDARGERERLLSGTASLPAARPLRLRSLSAAGVARYLRQSAFPQADGRFCAACQVATGGNPFLLQELVTELVERRIRPDADGATQVSLLGPPGVATMARTGLQAVGAGALELARAIAVLGDQSEIRHAASLAGLGSEPAAALADGLVSAGLLARTDSLSFVHPVVRRSVYLDVPPAERAELHRAAARLLRDEAAAPERVAAHLMASEPGGSEWVVEALLAASRRSLARGVPAAAVGYLRRALREPPSGAQRGSVTVELGGAEAAVGEPLALERLFEGLGLISDPGGRARTTLEIGRVLFARGRHTDAAEMLGRGVRELRGRDPALGARLESEHAAVARLAVPNALAQSARPRPDRDRPGSGEFAGGRARLAHDAFRLALEGTDHLRVRAIARRALTDGTLLADETSDSLTYHLAAGALVVAEDYEPAEAALFAALADAQERGAIIAFALASYLRSLVHLSCGRLMDARTDAENALRRRGGWMSCLAGLHAVLAETLLERDQLAEAAQVAEAGGAYLADADNLSAALFLCGRGRVARAGGRLEDALSDRLEAGRRLGAIGAMNPAVAPWRTEAARTAARLGRASLSRRLAEEDVRRAEAFGAPGALGRALHTLALAQARDEDRMELLEHAAVTLRGSAAKLDEARALIDFGVVLRRSQRHADAREPLRRGLDLARSSGARTLVRRALAEIRAAGGRPRRLAASGPEALTPREREVVDLVVEGMSNREIADTLFVTVKTVEWHLHQAFRKLEVGSRRELGAALGRTAQRHDRGA